MNPIQKVIEESNKQFDEKFGKDQYGGEEPFRQDKVKPHISTTISKILSAIEAEVGKIQMPEYQSEGSEHAHEGYIQALSDIQELLKQAKDSVK